MDKMKAEEGYINDFEIRQTTVQAVVDTGAMNLVINEQLRQQLGLGVVGEREATLADNTKRMVKIAEPVEIHWSRNGRDSLEKPFYDPSTLGRKCRKNPFRRYTS